MVNHVRRGCDIISRAGTNIDIASDIPEFDLALHIVGYNFDQDDLDQHVQLLKVGVNDAWMFLLEPAPKHPEETGFAKTPTFGVADEPWRVPKIHVSQGLRAWPPRSVPQNGKHEKPDPELAYIMIVQGRSGSIRSKLIVRSNLDLAGVEMFHMAANGFSVVFSGAILRENLEKRKKSGASFKKVNTREELQALESNSLGDVIGVLC
jgi:hypothetical protein